MSATSSTAGRLLIVGSPAVSSLENSYKRAAASRNWEVDIFNPEAELLPFIKGGLFGKVFNQFVPVDAWVRKMNRRLVVRVREWKPQLILIFTNVPVLYGTLATIKTVHDGSLIWIWPDTPMNLMPHNADASRLYDLSCVYSRAALPVFEYMGFQGAFWLPLAGDPDLHGQAPFSGDFDSDLSFVGMWRPEREKALVSIIHHFPQLNIEIYGTYWKDRCLNKSIKKYVRGKGILGKDLGRYFNRSRINLNVIDATNYPAANMRFFEIPTAGGLQLSSSCPEQENEFRHRQEVVYFQNDEQLLEELQWVLANPDLCADIRRNAHAKIHAGHTYAHRFAAILEKIHSYKQIS